MEERLKRRAGIKTQPSTQDEEESEGETSKENQSSLINEFAEAASGVSKPRVLMDMTAPQSTIDDKYGFLQPTDATASREVEDKRDLQTIKREDFLSIVKEGNQNRNDSAADDDLPNIERDGVKFKRDDGEFRLKTSATPDNNRNGKPLIQELSSSIA